MFNADQFKRSLMSIFVGFVISALTLLFQDLIVWLRHVSPEVPGAVAGAVIHHLTWKTPHQG